MAPPRLGAPPGWGPRASLCAPEKQKALFDLVPELDEVFFDFSRWKTGQRVWTDVCSPSQEGLTQLKGTSWRRRHLLPDRCVLPHCVNTFAHLQLLLVSMKCLKNGREPLVLPGTSVRPCCSCVVARKCFLSALLSSESTVQSMSPMSPVSALLRMPFCSKTKKEKTKEVEGLEVRGGPAKQSPPQRSRLPSLNHTLDLFYFIIYINIYSVYS